MADNVTLTTGSVSPPSGTIVAADEVSIDGATAKVQRVKPVHGVAGSAVDASATNPFPVTPAVAGDGATTLTNGRKVSTTVGTAVVLRSTLACKWVQVTALVTNTTRVYVGGTGVLATAGSQTGTPLAAGESVTIPVADAASVFLDVLTSGEGVSFLVGS